MTQHLQDVAARAIVIINTSSVNMARPDRGGRAVRGGLIMGIIKLIGAALGVLVAAAIIVPLVILAGLFVWLKLTEEADEEALELEQEAGV
jgi:hypothetical protein